ncbi:MAG: protein kinase, partial [Bradymonadaceae bacterium]
MAHRDVTRIGPFELVERIDEGGMGTVFRARHDGDDTEVALKILQSERARQPRFQRDFRREVQALARLHHPGIATVYDYGTLERSLEGDRAETPDTGVPWLAMEYVDGATIGERASDWDWQALESRILQLLDALAHAHAHDVVHRDLKPSNLLIPDDGSSLSIVDFGIAAVFEDRQREGLPDAEDRVRGTPKYMAPEQIVGAWRDQGPWTDLYAAGCMIWQIVCRRPPFDGETTEEILEAHLERRPSGFYPRMAVPTGTEDWLEGLIAQDPDRRFRCAADAAWAFVQLISASSAGDEQSPDLDIEPEADTIHLQPTVREVTGAPLDNECAVGESAVSAGRGGGSELREQRPPIPADWRRDSPDTDAPLSSAGLELFGLRRLPIVDREPTRDLLWSELRAAHQSGDVSAVILRGDAGCGKSKVADWLTRRAEETGAAVSLRAEHGPTGGPSEGLAAMVARYFRLGGLSASEAVERLIERLTVLGLDRSEALFDARGIVAEAGIGSEDDRGHGFESGSERQAALRRILGAIGGGRAVVVRLEDVPRNRRTLRFVEYVIEETTDHTVPMLVLMTARSEEWDERPATRSLRETIAAADCARTVDLEPLAPRHHREMIRRMLRFSDELVDEIVEQTSGHPLFAVQLVTDWLERGVIVSTPGGLALDDRRRATVPRDLDHLWLRRTQELISGYPRERRSAIRRALEIAAALGKEIVLEEWRQVLDRAGLDPPDSLVGRLVELGLVERTSQGWRFVHELAVDALRRDAERRGRLDDHHRRCAEALAALYPDRLHATGERRATHWRAAGDLERVADALREAVSSSTNEDRARHSDLLDRRASVLETMGIAQEDRRWVQNWLRRSECLRVIGDFDGAEAYAERARRTAKR